MADEQVMEERARRIVESAVELAERGGFEAVRIRDIAADAKVALGTLYKRFGSKEEILLAVLDHEVEGLEGAMDIRPAGGDSPVERVCAFFEAATRVLTARPKLARAVLRATVSGDPDLTDKVARYHDRVGAMVAAAFHGDDEVDAGLSAAQFQDLAYLLSQLWFTGLVGWMGGLHDEQAVIDQIRKAARWLVAGMQAEGTGTD